MPLRPGPVLPAAPAVVVAAAAPAGDMAVTLDFGRHWCPRHLEPYRAQWPKGAPLAMMRLAEAAAAMPAVIDAAEGDANRLGDALDRFAPLCCFVPAQTLQAIYRETAPGPAGAAGGAADPPPPAAPTR